MSENFNLDAIDKTFTSYRKGQIFDGVVVLKREDGVIFNIGGKNDAFIPCEDFEDFNLVKIGDRFKAAITNTKNEEGLIECSKRIADSFERDNQSAAQLKVGSKLSFVVSATSQSGLSSRLGEWKIFVPAAEVTSGYIKDLSTLLHKHCEAVVVEIDSEKKDIVASIKLLKEREKEKAEDLFWSSTFLNKIVRGTVKKIMPYGCFVDVGGVNCFLHISNISYERIAGPEVVVKVGQSYDFKVVELDREAGRVGLSMKALQEDPKLTKIKALRVGDVVSAEVVKILKFGAILRTDNGVSGLLHISDATSSNTKQIYEVVKLGQRVEAVVLKVDTQEMRVSFGLPKESE